MAVNEKLVITPQEAMKLLGVGRNTMYEVILKDKTFPAFKIGRKIYVNKQGMQNWINSKCKIGVM